MGPRGNSQTLLLTGHGQRVFGPVAEAFGSADFAVANLECPLVERSSPVAKPGKNHGAAPGCSLGLKEAGLRAVGLANNHILDHGWAGIESTIRACRQAGLETFGAGEDLVAADIWLVKELRGLRVAFAAVCEREWCFADDRSGGAAPLDVIRFARLVRARQGGYDVLILLVHGGTEYMPLPSPRFQNTCRFLVELGADAVLCQHSHVAGACEWHQGRPILYGQGNLLAPRELQMTRAWHWGCVALLEIEPETRHIVLRRVPYVQSLDQVGVRGMSAAETSEFEAQMAALDQEVTQPESVHSAWREHCERQKNAYFARLRGYVGWRQRLNVRLPMAEQLSPGAAKRQWLNLLRCDAHREAAETVLEASCGWPLPRGGDRERG